MLPALIPALFHTGSSSLIEDTLCSHLLALLAGWLSSFAGLQTKQLVNSQNIYIF